MRTSFLVLAAFVIGCGGDGASGIDPTDVRFGDTALVVVVNPTINEANRHQMPTPGPARGGVVLSSDDGLSDPTGADGIAVLAPLTAGLRTITVVGGGIDGTFSVMIGDGELRELAVAAEATRVEVMLEIDYRTNGVVEIDPSMTNAQVNDALKPSDSIVFLRGGTYTGDLDFSGSRVTLFGEGVLGGAVTIDGNVTMSGSDSRIRGARITGNVSVPASGTGMSFSRVDGAASAAGSDTTLLANALCGTSTITGSGSIVVGNSGTAPITNCP
jgi:hypothetical protein